MPDPRRLGDVQERLRLAKIMVRQRRLALREGVNDFYSWFTYWELHKGRRWAFKQWPKVPGEP